MSQTTYTLESRLRPRTRTATPPVIEEQRTTVSRYTSNPTMEAIESVKRILRYLKLHQTDGITYHRSTKAPILVSYSDADWAGEKDTAESTTGSLHFLAEGPVSWSSKKQKTIALSSTESEYIAASEATREVVWLRKILAAAGYPQRQPTILFCDNRTTILLTSEDSTTDRRKHINVKYHYIRSQLKEGMIQMKWIETKEQLADIMTKAMPPLRFNYLQPIIMGIGTIFNIIKYHQMEAAKELIH